MTQLDEALPELSMDADQIGQVVINLLVNAQHVLDQQSQPRRIVLETGQSRGGIYCRVTDNGPGVPPELQQRIFDPFFTTKGSNVGTGVGLSVSRGIAREHGGDLSLQDGDLGASFVLRLPLDSKHALISQSDNLNTVDELHGDHVLVVDDEPEVAELVAEILRSAGLTATLVHSGQEAMRWLETNPCDLILSDIRMPDMDGAAFWRAVREQYPNLTGRMAFITGDTLSASIAPFLEETGLPWLEKPFTPEQLLALVPRIEVD